MRVIELKYSGVHFPDSIINTQRLDQRIRN
jgi:hypothetical protein